MEQKHDNANLAPMNHPNSNLPGDSKLRSELTLLQRKYNRLEQKEKRIQVRVTATTMEAIILVF